MSKPTGKCVRTLLAVLTICTLAAGCAAAEQGGTSAQSDAPGVSAAQSASASGVSAAQSAASGAETPVIVSGDSADAVDFAVFQNAMPAEDYETLTAFLPVLEGRASFRWTAGPERGGSGAGWETRDATLAEFHDERWRENGPAPDTLPLNCLTVQDVDGDGGKELCLLFEELGWYYLILRQEGDAFYGTDLGVRWFENLQTNGVYVGSGGAGDSTYARMSFWNGAFEEQELGRRVEGATGCTCTLAGAQVTEEEFDAWLGENLPGEASWFAPDGTASRGIAA